MSNEDWDRMRRHDIDGYLGGDMMDFSKVTDWSDYDSDPLHDFLTNRDAIVNNTGFWKPTIITNQATADAYAAFLVWFEETKKRLESTPRRRWITRLVLRRQLWGPWYKRSRRIQSARWKIREWRHGEDWDV